MATQVIRYEIWGGTIDSLEDSGRGSFFEDCSTLDEAREALAEWHKDYRNVVWI